jgi:hypothetical protein
MRALPHNVVLYLGGSNTAQTVKRHHSPAKKGTSTPETIYSRAVVDCYFFLKKIYIYNPSLYFNRCYGRLVQKLQYFRLLEYRKK